MQYCHNLKSNKLQSENKSDLCKIVDGMMEIHIIYSRLVFRFTVFRFLQELFMQIVLYFCFIVLSFINPV